jgi:hypothetical protein
VSGEGQDKRNCIRRICAGSILRAHKRKRGREALCKAASVGRIRKAGTSRDVPDRIPAKRCHYWAIRYCSCVQCGIQRTIIVLSLWKFVQFNLGKKGGGVGHNISSADLALISESLPVKMNYAIIVDGKIMKNRFRNNLLPGTSTAFYLDFWLYFLIVAFCFISFNHADILHTSACVGIVLNGHIFDFYETVPDVLVLGSNYLPATYVVFSLWGLPLKFLGFFRSVGPLSPVWLFFWFKIMTSLFFSGSAVVFYRLCFEFTKDHRRALLACVIWVSSPVAIFSQFIFGQYDVIHIFFMLLGLLYYVRGDLLRFSFWFSVSVMFKYFPVFIFFPLLALKEKDIKKIIFYSAVLVSPNLIQIALFLHSGAFVKGVLGFGAAKKALDWRLALWSLVPLYAYFVNYKTREPRDLYLSAKLALLSVAIIFWITGAYPQWLLVVTPFIAILLACAENIKAMLFVDMIFTLAYFNFTFQAYRNHGGVDTNLFSLGLWGLFNPAFRAVQPYSLSLVGIYRLGIQRTMSFFHIYITCLFLMVFISRRYPSESSSERVASPPPYALIRLRFYGIMGVFLVSAFYAYYRTLAL